MPFIKVKTAFTLTYEQETKLKEGLGKVIENVPYKSEQYLLIDFEDQQKLWLKGRKSEDIVYIEGAVFANECHFGYEDFSRELTDLFSKILNISKDKIYIRYEDISAWSIAGNYIDRTF
ncbi:MAG: phenylpyruvate tautomerase MIF-related protein [Succinivibrio dextrinosolvens]|nr:phenylpyruvate tautomerase MIF-related protein [Succinivibrio dextrinosolvens]